MASGYDYQQISTVTQFHLTPRFGHSNNFAHLASQDYSQDYLQGLVALAIFLFSLTFVWLSVLALLKICLGRDRVGCAAGGDKIDVQYIKKKQKHLKPILRRIVKRSWRVQFWFFAAAILLPITTCLFLKKGLHTTVESLEEIQQIAYDIDLVTYRGIAIVKSMTREHARIQRLQHEGYFDLHRYCPLIFGPDNNNTNSTTSVFGQNISINDLTHGIQSTLEEIDTLINDNVHYAGIALATMSDMTKKVDETVDWIIANDWQPKMCLLTLNVINVALMIGVLISRNNVVHFPYKCMLVWLLVPVFVLLLILSALASSGFGLAVSVNADFCAGGAYPGSPEATINDIIFSFNITTNDLTYKSFQHYMQACTTENPLEFLAEFSPQISQAITEGHDFIKLVGEYGVDSVNQDCGADIAPLIEALQRLMESLETMQNSLESAQSIADCSTISPILRRIFHGASCKEAVEGLAWMFGTTFGITILGLIMVTLRASLYNATIRSAKRRRKDETEREWDEYKEFMAQFYDNAHTWKLQCEKKGDDQVTSVPSFDTGITKASTMDEDDDDTSDAAHLEMRTEEEEEGDEDNSYGYDSDESRYEEGSAEPFKTPPKQPTFVEQVKTAEKIRNLVDVLDEELRPLSPELAPAAPQKSQRNLRRTTQSKLLW